MTSAAVMWSLGADVPEPDGRISRATSQIPADTRTQPAHSALWYSKTWLTVLFNDNFDNQKISAQQSESYNYNFHVTLHLSSYHLNIHCLWNKSAAVILFYQTPEMSKTESQLKIYTGSTNSGKITKNMWWNSKRRCSCWAGTRGKIQPERAGTPTRGGEMPARGARWI